MPALASSPGVRLGSVHTHLSAAALRGNSVLETHLTPCLGVIRGRGLTSRGLRQEGRTEGCAISCFCPGAVFYSALRKTCLKSKHSLIHLPGSFADVFISTASKDSSCMGSLSPLSASSALRTPTALSMRSHPNLLWYRICENDGHGCVYAHAHI